MQTIQSEFTVVSIGGYYSLDADTIACEVLNSQGDLSHVLVTGPKGQYINNRAYDAIVNGSARDLTAEQYAARKVLIESRRQATAGLNLN